MFIASLKRFGGHAFKAPRSPLMPCMPSETSLVNTRSYFKPFAQGQSRYLMYGSTAVVRPLACTGPQGVVVVDGLSSSLSGMRRGMASTAGMTGHPDLAASAAAASASASASAAASSGNIGTPPASASASASAASAAPIYGGGGGGGQPTKTRQLPKMTIPKLSAKCRKGEKITMLTAYDYPTAKLIDGEGIDLVLVGDSVGMVVLGLESTTGVDMDQMVHHSAAVTRGISSSFVVGDLPFGAYITPTQAAENAVRLMKEGGVDGVKLEGGKRAAPAVAAMVDAGIPVMGHIGLTPQTTSQLGGYGVQGKTAAAALALVEDALALQEAGCFSIVLECVPDQVADYVTRRLRVPTIGIGSGNRTSGQVLVSHDIFGLFDAPPRLAKRYGNAKSVMQAAVRAYRRDVLDYGFPGPDHSTRMKPKQLDAFMSCGPIAHDRGQAEAGLLGPVDGIDDERLLEFFTTGEEDNGEGHQLQLQQQQQQQQQGQQQQQEKAQMQQQQQQQHRVVVGATNGINNTNGQPPSLLGMTHGRGASSLLDDHTVSFLDGFPVRYAAAAGIANSAGSPDGSPGGLPELPPLRKVVVIGGGAMGSLMASTLALHASDTSDTSAGSQQEKLEVWMLSSYEDHLDAIAEEGGLMLESPNSSSASSPSSSSQRLARGVCATSSPDTVVADGTKADLVIIATKGGDASVAAAEVARDTLLKPGAPALTVQNGVNGHNVAAVLGADRVLCGVTSNGATLVAPGVVRQAGAGPTFMAPFSSGSGGSGGIGGGGTGGSSSSNTGGFGNANNNINDVGGGGDTAAMLLMRQGLAAAELLSAAGLETSCLPARDLEPMIWRKLLVNAVINPITALVGRTNECVADPALEGLVDSIISEVVSVGSAAGVPLPADPKGEVMHVARATAPNVSSMLADVRRGVPTEISTINGFIVREARKHGVDVPVNRTLAQMLEARAAIGHAAAAVGAVGSVPGGAEQQPTVLTQATIL